jgi:hypothetical protein
MANIKIIQNSFQFGEVSRLLHARVDSPIYNRAVRRLRNMLVIPQGGAERRFGLDWIDYIGTHPNSDAHTIERGAAVTDYTDVKPYIFDYEDGTRWLFIFRPLFIDIYTGTQYHSTIASPYKTGEIAGISIAQSSNVMFIAHGTYAPRTIVRTDPDPYTFTLATPTFKNYPVFDFTRQYDAYDFSVQYAAAPITTNNNVLGAVVTLTSSTAMFNEHYVGGLFFADGGVIRITAIGAVPWPLAVVTGRIVNIFDSQSTLFVGGTNIIKGSDCVVTERAFSGDVANAGGGVDPIPGRGWPQKVAFFQNRLFLGRTSSLLGGIWGSNYNGYDGTFLNFDDSEALDTNAISTVLQGSKSTIVQHMMSFKTLLVFTTSGLYSTPLLIDLPITPSNVSFLNLQTADAANNVVPVVFDNDVVFFDKGGKKVKNVNVLATTQHYETKNISVLAPHLVDEPISAAVFENSSSKDGSWLFMVNKGSSSLDDGTAMDGALSVYQSVPEQEITAWSLSTTPGASGKFRHVVSDEERVYFVTERVLTVFNDPASILVKAVDETALLILGGAGGVAIFVADSDTMTIGSAAKFSGLQFQLDTNASVSIDPLFEYSTGVGTWAAFTPAVDNTNGLTGSNTITWVIDDLATWAVGAGAEFLIRMTRQEAAAITNPIADVVALIVPDQTRLFIERLTFDYALDAAIETTPTVVPGKIVIGLDHLEGETVRILADEASVANKTVSNGSITLDEDASIVQIGLNWTPEITPLPLNVTLADGNNLYHPKSIKQVYVDFYKSSNIKVNGQLIPPFRFNEDVYNAPALLQTDFVNVMPMTGWDADAEITISQTEPLPMTIIGFGFTVSV